jgi:hypothetical protein
MLCMAPHTAVFVSLAVVLLFSGSGIHAQGTMSLPAINLQHSINASAFHLLHCLLWHKERQRTPIDLACCQQYCCLLAGTCSSDHESLLMLSIAVRPPYDERS